MKFYDTSSLLLLNIYDIQENFAISSITLNELELIKTDKRKTEDIKNQARQITNWLFHNRNKYEVIIFSNKMLNDNIIEKGLEINNDIKILSCAIWYDRYIAPDDTIFVTNDLSLFNIANLFFGEDSIESVLENEDNYTGYKDIKLNDIAMAELYEGSMANNICNLNTNEYLIVRDCDNNIKDLLKWNGIMHTNLKYKLKDFESMTFGAIKPYHSDIYQKLAFDSLSHNKITMLKGPAGSGKTFIALSYLFAQLEKHNIDKIIVFCNTIATKNSARLGFYPGTRDEKLLDSQIGNLLSSKLGSKMAVEKLITEEKLMLLPFSDIRGFDTTGMNAGIYISEAQNLDITLMKLAL